jgi:integrase
MSVYKPKGSPFYQYDFQMRGRRFHGSTKCRSRREAEAVERGERERARELLKVARGGAGALTIDVAAGRYWAEVGRHHADSAGTFRDLERLIGYFGKDKLLAEITDDDVAKLVAWRRGHRVLGRSTKMSGKGAPLVTPATVNRSTTQVIQKLFTRAKAAWGMRFDHEPNWRQHRLKEPEERVRELKGDEAHRLSFATRGDYGPFFDFARASGLRLRECLLRWSEVDWIAGQIKKQGKGGRTVVVPITTAIRRILWPLRGHNDVMVFTYVAARTRHGRIKGQRYPITFNGVKTQWKRIRAKAKVDDFRFHDFRHDFASKLLRQTGNLKLVQKALNHADIKTTIRYAHVLDEELRSALEEMQGSTKSRNQSRTKSSKAS